MSSIVLQCYTICNQIQDLYHSALDREIQSPRYILVIFFKFFLVNKKFDIQVIVEILIKERYTDEKHIIMKPNDVK